jgi:DNA-binding HxlR family transcriptional regulator
MTTNSTRDRKCYGQACTVTTALDVAGDRWTLLILRELLGGPARFEDLVGGLPGIARNLLSGRLRRLEDDGVVRRRQANGVSLYAVTDLGAAVRPAIEELGFWGLRLPRVAPATYPRSLRAIAMAVQPRPVMSDMVVGQPFDDAALDLVAGDTSLLQAFTNAMRAPFKQLA